MRAIAILLVLLSGCALAPHEVTVRHEAGVSISCDHACTVVDEDATHARLVFAGFPTSGVKVSSGRREAFVRCDQWPARTWLYLAGELTIVGIPVAIEAVARERLHDPLPDSLDLRPVDVRIWEGSR